MGATARTPLSPWLGDPLVREIGQRLKRVTPFEALVDETLQTAMDLGAMKAPDGALRLTDKLTELRRQLLERASGA